MNRFRHFVLWYFDHLWKAFRAFRWWADDGSGWVGLIASIYTVGVFLVGGGLVMAGATDAASWFTGIAGVIFITAILLFGPLILAYRQHFKDLDDLEKKKKRITELTTPKIEILKEVDFGEVAGEAGALAGEHHWRVSVQNFCSNSEFDCHVSLVRCEPKVKDIPLLLHCTQEEERRSSIKLKPGEKRKWDIFRENPITCGFVFTGVNAFPFVPIAPFKTSPWWDRQNKPDWFTSRRCVVCIAAFCSPGPAVEQWFEIGYFSDGRIPDPLPALRPIDNPSGPSNL